MILFNTKALNTIGNAVHLFYIYVEGRHTCHKTSGFSGPRWAFACKQISPLLNVRVIYHINCIITVIVHRDNRDVKHVTV